jgi:hypothetical protein
LSQVIPTRNAFERVAATTVLSAIGTTFGEAIASGLATNQSMTQIAELGMSRFGGNLVNAFQKQAIGAVSVYLTSELAESLGFDGRGFDGRGFGDQLLRTATGSVIDTLVSNAYGVATGAQGASLFNGFSGAEAGGNLYVKRALALSTATTVEALTGDLKVGEDYGRYRADRELIEQLTAVGAANDDIATARRHAA